MVGRWNFQWNTYVLKCFEFHVPLNRVRTCTHLTLFLHAFPGLEPVTDSDKSLHSKAERVSRTSDTFLLVLRVVTRVNIRALQPLQLDAEEIGQSLKFDQVKINSNFNLNFLKFNNFFST